MESKSKIKLEFEEVRGLTNNYLKNELIELTEITEGWFNTIYLLKLVNGEKVGLKIAPPQEFEPMTYEKDLILAEIGVQSRLVEEGIKGTKIICSGKNLLCGQEMDWFMYSWVEGQNLGSSRQTMGEQEQSLADIEVSRELGMVNSITSGYFGRWNNDNSKSTTWGECFAKITNDLIFDSERKNIELPWEATEINALLKKSLNTLNTVKIPSLVLWDLHDGNIIVDPQTGRVKAFIDGDRALWGDPLMEFYFRSFLNLSDNWLSSYLENFKGDKNLLDLKSELGQLRIYWYDFYLALVMVIEKTYRGYAEDHDTWAKNMGNEAFNKIKDLLNI